MSTDPGEHRLRDTHYLEQAREARRLAADSKSPETYRAGVTLAAGWTALALLQRSGVMKELMAEAKSVNSSRDGAQTER